MALTGQLAPNIASQGPAWLFDDAIGELVPYAGVNVFDLGRSLGQPASRFLVNRMVPESTFGWTSAAGTAVTTTGAETTMLTSAGWKGAAYSGLTPGTIPALFLNRVGKIVYFEAFGVITGTGSTPTLDVKLKFGTTIVIDTGVRTTASVAGTLPWNYYGFAMVTVGGAAGFILGQGQFIYNTAATAMVGWSAYTSAAQAIDLTAAQAIDLTAAWSAAGSPSITCQGLTVSVLN
ncbi:MAG: hypothetical protein ACHRXM_37125 [Isosphaerales bacterium]